MKTTLFVIVLCLLSTASALAQATTGTSYFSNEPVAIHVPSHPERASQKDLAQEQSLLGNSTYTYAHGELPLWEVGPKPVFVSLGEVARLLRKEHAAAKKATKILEN